MNWLIWREYRRNRPILIAALGLLLLPYTIALWVLLWPRVPPNALEAFGGAALNSVVLAMLVPAFLGGNAIAGERNDRSAQFVAYLPLSRSRRLTAKLSVILTGTVVLWGMNLLILLIVLGTAPQASQRLDNGQIPNLLGYSTITGLVFFGVAWMISSLQSSPTFAVCGGLITPAVILMGLQGAAWGIGSPDHREALRTFERFMEIGYPVICAIVAVVCFSIGTWYYLRRVEP